MYALKLNLEHFGAGAWVLADNFADLGWHYFNNDQLEKAEEMLRRAVALQEGHYGVDSDHTRALLGQLAMSWNPLYAQSAETSARPIPHVPDP